MPGCRHRAPSPSGPRHGAFTLVELLLTTAIVAILGGLLVPALGLMRERVRHQEARQIVAQLAAALRTYATLDQRHRLPLEVQLYPAPVIPVPHPLGMQAQGGAAAGVRSLLVAIDAGVAATASADAAGNLIDPWGRPYRYQLTRPAPSSPADALTDWNWDPVAGSARAWNRAADAPAPFPYVWSSGRDGSAIDATTWIYEADP